jgi:WS/DGAT/MGAT family acyltransferase
MSYVHSDRLSAIDAAFLAVEDANSHMHIGSVALFEAAPLLRDDGGLDLERILAFTEAQLHKAPRLRQKIARVPGFEQPLWVDDASFNLTYPVRHTALPVPGDVRQLKRLAGRVMSQQLDHGKPLWEIWVVEGIVGGRFAVISKLHHCMVDGVSAGDVLNVLMGRKPGYGAPPARKWVPRAAPSPGQMVADEIRHRLTLPFSLLRSEERGPVEQWKVQEAVRKPLPERIAASTAALRPMASTPLNVEVGPHRRLDWTRLDMEQVKRVRAQANGKVNDVVLAVISGALAGFLKRRGTELAELDFRASIPVSVRTEGERGSLGNRVSSLLASLPLDEPDPWRRLLRIIETTRELKGSGQAGGGERLERLAELVPPRLFGPLVRWGMQHQVANLVITNVPGPNVPVYMLGARMEASYPVVPLAAGQALGVALYSYDGGLYWGLNSDWDVIPDLHDLVEDIPRQFEALQDAAPSARKRGADTGAGKDTTAGDPAQS